MAQATESLLRRLLRGEQLRRAAANFGWLMTDRLLRMGVGLFVVVLVARHLGPSDYGVLAYAGAVVSSFGALGSMGLDALVVRDLVRTPARADEILGTALVMRFCGAVASVAISIFVVWCLKRDDQLAIGLVAILSCGNLFLVFDTIDLWLQSRVLGRFAVIARALPLLIMAGARIALALAGAPVQAFAIAATVEAAFAGLGLVVVYRLRGESFRTWKPARSRAIALLREGWPLFVSVLIVAARLRLEQIMLGQIAGYGAVAQYAVASRVVDVWTVVPMTVMVSLFPAIVRARERAAADYLINLQRLYDGLIWAAVLFAAVFWIFGPTVLVWLFSARYAPAGDVLTVLVWSCIWISFALARGRWLVAEGHTGDALLVEAGILLVGLAANMFLIPRHGATGAAWANLIALLLGNLLVAGFSAPVRLSLVMLGRSLTLPVRSLVGSGDHRP